MNTILTKINWDTLNIYIEKCIIVANKHLEYDLWILNYSPKTQANRFWDLFTLTCRGLVIDVDGNIIARPMKKFFNYEEADPYEINMSQEYEIFNKMDGSMILVFWYELKKKWIVASRGSFISDQAMEAKKMLALKPNIYDKLDKHYTYIFEVIYNTNRIVVSYGNLYDLILLVVIETKTGKEISYDDLVRNYNKHFMIVERFDIKVNNLLDLKKLEEDNKEGFVVKFADGHRLKVKFDEYCRLHGIITNVSNITVWEHLLYNYDFDQLFERVPDEMFNWLKKTTRELYTEFNEIERLALKEFMKIYFINGITERKAFALNVTNSEYRSILFKLYDKKPYDEIIWKMIKPVYSKPFKDGYEDVE